MASANHTKIVKCALLALVISILAFASPARALILQGDSSGLDVPDRPADGVIGKWASNASAVAIMPNYAITTRHQGGGVGSTITFDGTSYIVSKVTNCYDNGNITDLRIVQLANSHGAPANLTEYAGLYSNNDEIGKSAVIGGYGMVAGDELTTSTGIHYGYSWANPKTLNWGTNIIDSTGSLPAGSYNSYVIKTDFDESTAGGATEYESAIASGDSGGGVFIYSSGKWLVAGLSAYTTRNNASWFGDKNYFIRISSYSDFLADPANSDEWMVLPGDANWDGIVDQADYDALADNFETTVLSEGMTWWQMGDFNSDSSVDLADYDILAANFGLDSRAGMNGGTLGTPPPPPAPEPATILTLLIGGIGLSLKKRLRKRTVRASWYC